MGIAEEAGKVATGVVQALTGTPALLVMVLLNIAMIGSAAWYLDRRESDVSKLIFVLADRCFPSTHGSASP